MVYINGMPSLRDPEVCEWIIDERIEKIELINGNTVQDYGHVASGDILSIEVIYKGEYYNAIMALWETRQKVQFIDEGGTVWNDMRLVVKKVRYVKKHPQYLLLTLEFWNV